MTDAEIVILANALVGELEDAGADTDDKICVCSAALALALREMPREQRHRRLMEHVDAQLENLELPDDTQAAPGSAVH